MKDFNSRFGEPVHISVAIKQYFETSTDGLAVAYRLRQERRSL